MPAGTLDGEPGAGLERKYLQGLPASWYLPVDELPFFDKTPKS